MAEVQEPETPAQEPSMEEILASIRKIISDDAPGAAAPAVASSDVIELTQMVQDDGSVVDVKPAPLPEEKPMPPEPTPSVAVEAAKAVSAKAASAPAAETLVSEPVVSSAASSLSSLASTVEIERLAAAPLTSTGLGNGTRTLEDMAIELMRPLLKQWLDQNLPATVDRLVQKEIERISRKSNS